MSLFSLVGIGAEPARADLTDPVLRDARQSLRRYDLAGGTLDTLRSLTRFLPGAEGADVREARFLRAVAATDYLLLAQRERAAGHREALADVLLVNPDEIEAYLDQELADLSFGVYAAQSAECRWVLQALRAAHRDPGYLRRGEGFRRDVMFVNAVVDLLGHENEIDMLGRYGTDPCEGEDLARCELGGFTADGRQALDAMLEAERALTRVERVESRGEPLTGSLAGIVAADGAVLRTADIYPVPRLPTDVAVHGVGSRGTPARPELLMVLSQGQIRYGYLPWVRVSDGHLVTGSIGEPTLPQMATLSVPADGRTAITPFEALEESFRELASETPVTSVGLAAVGDVESLVVSRVLYTAHRAGLPSPDLISRGLEGEARSVPIRLVIGEPESPLDRSLYIRMGGYTWSIGNRRETIPRVRNEEGLHFDLQTLADRAQAEVPPSTGVRYMGVVEWGTVLDATFHLPRPENRIALLLY